MLSSVAVRARAVDVRLPRGQAARSSSRPTCSRSFAPTRFSGGTAPTVCSGSASGTARGPALVRLRHLGRLRELLLGDLSGGRFSWFFARGLFRRFVAMVSLLALMGFATYALFPPPPWMASEFGQLEPTTRSIGSIWNRSRSRTSIPSSIGALVRKSGRGRPPAAVPPLLIALFLWRRPPVGPGLLAAYPPAMAFASFTRPSTTSWTSSSAGPTPWSRGRSTTWPTGLPALELLALACERPTSDRPLDVPSRARSAGHRRRAGRECARARPGSTGAHPAASMRVRSPQAKPVLRSAPRTLSVENDAAKNRSSQSARSSDRPRASPDPTSPRDSC